MTRYLQDILRQPDELQKTLEYLSGAGRQTVNYIVEAEYGLVNNKVAVPKAGS